MFPLLKRILQKISKSISYQYTGPPDGAGVEVVAALFSTAVHGVGSNLTWEKTLYICS